MMKAKYSVRDNRGALLVDCAECERGGNGSNPDRCACGGRVKQGRKGGCFSGTLLKGLEVE